MAPCLAVEEYVRYGSVNRRQRYCRIKMHEAPAILRKNFGRNQLLDGVGYNTV